MTAPLSQDLGKRLVGAVEEGATARKAAARFAVSASAAIKLVRRVRQTGSTAPAKIGGYRKPLLAGQEAFLRELTTSQERDHLGRDPGAPSIAARLPGQRRPAASSSPNANSDTPTTTLVPCVPSTLSQEVSGLLLIRGAMPVTS